MPFETETKVRSDSDAPGKKSLKLGVLFIFSISLAVLYQGMRGVMHLGGYVARGGFDRPPDGSDTGDYSRGGGLYRRDYFSKPAVMAGACI